MKTWIGKADMRQDDGKDAVRLENVSRSFGITAAVRNISLQVPRGDVLSLVGHSGCGKSTLLRIIAGIETIDTGSVIIDGQQVAGSRFVEPEARKVGFVFQDYALFPHLSVRGNILFGLKGRPGDEAAVHAAAIIDQVGIGHLADRFPHTLSGGEQQRVALARALAPRPAIVLLDEPFSNLDQGLREKVRTDTLMLLKSLGTTVVMVTHDPQEALSAGDQVVLMRSGEIVQTGSAYDLHDRPANAYAAEFFCSSNRIPGKCRGDRVDTAIGVFPFRPGFNPREGVAMLHIRPQAITVSLDHGDIAARVQQRIFLGEAEQLMLKVEGLDAPLRAVTHRRLPGQIDTVRISIAAEQVLMF